MSREGLRGYGIALGVLLIAQVLLGIGNVKFGLPLAVAVAHNGTAALLLFAMVALLVRTQQMNESLSLRERVARSAG